MTNPNREPDPRTLPAVVVTFLARSGAPSQRPEVQAQVTSYADTALPSLDELYCSLLLDVWELTVCVDGSHAELFFRDGLTTLTMWGLWQATLRDLRVLLADPRLDLLLTLPTK